jgi:hypothetical protein
MLAGPVKRPLPGIAVQQVNHNFFCPFITGSIQVSSFLPDPVQEFSKIPCPTG